MSITTIINTTQKLLSFSIFVTINLKFFTHQPPATNYRITEQDLPCLKNILHIIQHSQYMKFAYYTTQPLYYSYVQDGEKNC